MRAASRSSTSTKSGASPSVADENTTTIDNNNNSSSSDDDDAILQPLTALVALRVLSLNDNRLVGDDTAPLASLRRLVQLNLAGNRLGTLPPQLLIDAVGRPRFAMLRSFNMARCQVVLFPSLLENQSNFLKEYVARARVFDSYDPFHSPLAH